MIINEKNPESPTSTTTSMELCRDLGVNPEQWWGRVNSYLCDAYHEGATAEREKARDTERALDRSRAEATRLRSELESARLGTVRAGAEVARLCARVAELEAALDVAGCDDCGCDCEDCEGEVS